MPKIRLIKATAKPPGRSSKKATEPRRIADTPPKFPYTNKPNSLRKFLEQIPKRPKPAKINAEFLRGWGLKDTNDQSIIRVLKALGFVGGNGEPTDKYVAFMTPGRGPAVLGDAIRQVWAPLFELSHQPNKEEDEKLRNYFNIHSGGSDKTLALQIQTFKAACDYADLSAAAQLPVEMARLNPVGGLGTQSQSQEQSGGPPTIHIDLHIHLPENKSRRDYEYIFEDIGSTSSEEQKLRTTMSEISNPARIAEAVSALNDKYGRKSPSTAEAVPVDVGRIILALDEFMECVRYLNTRRSSTILTLDSEAAVQDAIYLMLRPWVLDLVPENPTERIAASRYSIRDFVTRSAKAIIEAKFIRDAAHGKGITKELHDDIETYRSHPFCENLIFFIYDPDALIPDKAALSRQIVVPRTYDGVPLTCHLIVKP